MNITVLYLGKGNSAITYEISKAFLKRSYNLTCVFSQYGKVNSRFSTLQKQYANLKLFFIKTYKTPLQFILRTFNIFVFLRLVKIIEKSDPDYIYIPMMSVWASILCFFIHNKKIITAIHDINSHKGEKKIFIEILNRYCIKRSSKVIVHSQKFISMAIDKYGINKENICWIPLANYNYFVPDLIKPNDYTIYNKILFFGRIREYKGLEVLLKAIRIIVKTDNTIKLKIVGGGELSKQEIKLIENLGSRVELVNRYVADDEVHVFFEDIDFTVLPYIEASQSGVIMTSYSFKKPVVTTNIGGLPEQVLPTTGILIPPGDEIILSETILDLYKTPERIIQMGINGYTYATNELTWDKSAEKLINFMCCISS